MALYLIKRGPRPEWHRALFHPVVICDRKRIAQEEAGWSGDRAWVWRNDQTKPGYGWLLTRWEGLDIDLGHIVRGFDLPDGTHVGYWRDYPEGVPCILPLMQGAIWWSDRRMPEWLAERGAVYPPDHFSQQRILDTIADGCSGFGRTCPDWWPVDPEHPRPDGKAAVAMDAFAGYVSRTISVDEVQP